MLVQSKYAIGAKVIITSGRFEGFSGVVVDHFNSTSNDTNKIEAGITIENEQGEQRDAFDYRIELNNPSFDFEKSYEVDTTKVVALWINSFMCLDGKERTIRMSLRNTENFHYSYYLIKNGKQWGASHGTHKLNKKIFGEDLENAFIEVAASCLKNN